MHRLIRERFHGLPDRGLPVALTALALIFADGFNAT
jgi:hypothetical protein